MKQLLFCGIGSNGFSCLGTTSFSIDMEDDEWLLVDVGPDTPRSWKRVLQDFSRIRVVIITHRHLDHCLGLPYLLFGRKLDLEREPNERLRASRSALTIIAEEGVWTRLRELFESSYGPIAGLSYSVHFREIRDLLSRVETLGSVSASAILMDHTVPTFGLVLVDGAGRRLVYTSDSLPVAHFAGTCGADAVLIAEAMFGDAQLEEAKRTRHSTASMAGELATQVKPLRTYLVHLRPDLFQVRETLEQEARARGSSEIVFPTEEEILHPWGT